VQQRLQQRIQAARKVDGGFTLIELLIVIVILGVLAGVVVFSVQAISDRGNKAACNTDLRSIESAAAGYYADHNNTWPTVGGTTNDWTPLVPAYLKEPPNSTHTYSINTTTGVVTANPGC
jgi:general secretion pathway protein G